LTPSFRTANDGNVHLSDVPEIPAEISARLRPYQNTRFATFADWTKDGTGMFVSTRFASVAQLHRVDRPEGMRRQLTFSPEPIREAIRRPGGEELLFTGDVGGSEFFQLFLLEPDSGRIRLLTDGKSRNTEPCWAIDGERIAFTSTRRDGRSNDIWIVDAHHPESAHVVFEAQDGSGWTPIAWHPRQDVLLVEQYVSITDTRIHLLDLGTGTMQHVRGAPSGGDGSEPGVAGESVNAPVGFDEAAAGMFILTDADSEFRRLGYIDFTTSVLKIITGDIPWGVEFAVLDPGRRRLAFTTNENGSSRLHLLDTRTHAFQPVQRLPTGVAYGLRFSSDGGRLGFTFDSGISPADAHSLDLSADSLETGALTRWTFSEVGGLDPAVFIASRTIEFPSFDGRKIPAFLYEPRSEGPHPVVVHIHGGPESQSRPIFAAIFQSWILELGVAVLDPNVRGSDGYGKSYLKLDNGMLREDSVRDIGALLDWIATQPSLDSSRVLVYGGSYGGYMVLASLIHHGHRLRGGIDIVGISDFITFLENTQDYRRDLRRVEYGDERDPEMRAFFERASPLRNASRIAAPLFVIQGQNDPRVPVTEAEQIVAEVRAKGRPVWFMNALNEGHGYARKENQDLMRDAVFLFMRKFLLGL
jgi:dipeptidyl aminopeptidase/acylaminoacyl peptidase